MLNTTHVDSPQRALQLHRCMQYDNSVILSLSLFTPAVNSEPSPTEECTCRRRRRTRLVQPIAHTTAHRHRPSLVASSTASSPSSSFYSYSSSSGVESSESSRLDCSPSSSCQSTSQLVPPSLRSLWSTRRTRHSSLHRSHRRRIKCHSH